MQHERRARCARDAADRLRHVRAGWGAGSGRVRRGVAGGAGDRGRRPTRCGGCRCCRAEVGPEGAPTVVLHGHLDVVPGLAGAVRPADRGRPALRARRLRHEGGAGGDAGDHRRDARPGRRAGAARDRRRRGVRGGSRARQRPPGRQRLRRRLRDHRRADRPADRGRGQGRAGAAAGGQRGRRARRHALARRQRRARRRTTFSAVSSRYRLPGTARSCSTAPRSTSAGSWAATRSTRCPTDARSTSTSATCPTRIPATVLEQVRGLPDAEVDDRCSRRPPAVVDRDSPFVRGLREAAAAAPRRRADERRSRRRLRRGLLPARGGAGGRVRPGRRRPPRPRGVGLGPLAGGLPADARVVPAGDPGPARRAEPSGRAEPFKKPPPAGRPRAAAEAEALLVALHAGLVRDRPRRPRRRSPPAV